MPSKPESSRAGIAQAAAIAVVLLILLTGTLRIISYFESLKLQPQAIEPYLNVYKYLSGLDSSKPRRTLVLFANNAELRNGGGFLGSYGILEGKEGQLRMGDISNIYNIDYYESNAVLAQPLPFYMRLAPYNSLRDSGTHLSWPDNARDAIFFYERQTGEQVDSVIQISPQVLLELLRSTGSVDLKDYNIVVTPDNFFTTVQLEVESGKDKQAGKDPKHGILTTLANTVINRVLQKNFTQLQEYAALTQKLIEQKYIVMYSKDPVIQADIEKIGASGELKYASENNLLISEANTAGDKSSPYIKQAVTMHQSIREDGTSIVNITIKRTHTSDYLFPYVDPYSKRKEFLVKANGSFLQVVLPEHSTLLNTDVVRRDWFDLSRDNSTIFGFYSTLKPLQSSEISFSYQLPLRHDMSSQLTVNSFIYKQVGAWPYELFYQLELPKGYQLQASNLESATQSQNGDTTLTTAHAIIESDRVLSFIYHK